MEQHDLDDIELLNFDEKSSVEINKPDASYILGGINKSDDDDSVLLPLVPSDNNINDKIEELLDKHCKLLSYSIKIAIYWLIQGILYWFLHCVRWYVWILYARSLGQYNDTTIAFGVYTLYFIQAISCLFWSWIADKYRYDIFGILLCFVTIIGLFMESFAVNYLILLIGTIIVNGFRGIGPIGLAFIAKYLPHHYAVKYTSFRFAFIALSNLSGPVIGGVMTHLFGIKSVFYLGTIISILQFIFIIFFINGHENKIHSQQIEMKQLYDIINKNDDDENNIIINSDLLLIKNVDYQFPVSTEKYLLQKQKEEITSSTLTRYEWFMLINIMMANACTIGIEGAFSIYYVVFCLDLFNINVIHSTIMIGTMSISFLIGCVSVPPFIAKYKNENNFNIEYIALIINGIFIIIFILMTKYILLIIGKSWLWIYGIICGLELGVINMLQESILLSFQPKQHSGKVAGAKVFARNIMKAFLSLIIGATWSIDIYCFLYAQIAFFIIPTICIISMVIVQCMHPP